MNESTEQVIPVDRGAKVQIHLGRESETQKPVILLLVGTGSAALSASQAIEIANALKKKAKALT